jgi:hypothetical protein
MLAIPDGLHVTALAIAPDSLTLTAAMSPTSDPLSGGAVLYHWDLKKTGIAHEKLTVDWQMSDFSDGRNDSWISVETSAENSNWPPSRK